VDAIWFSSAHCTGTGIELWHVFMPCLSLKLTNTLPPSSILALQSHRNEDIATTFKPERVTRRALRQAEALPTFGALTLFPNPLAAVFLLAGGNTAHQQNLNRVKFNA
jgi:hypothetical protein